MIDLLLTTNQFQNINYSKNIYKNSQLKNIYPILNTSLIDNQHGFRPERSTITNVVIVKQNILDSFSLKAHTDVIYTDFNRAFDRIDHNLLILKF